MVILEVELEEMVEVHIPECHERLGPGNTLEHLAEKHGDIYRLRVGDDDWIVISSYKLAHQVMSDPRLKKVVPQAQQHLPKAYKTVFPRRCDLEETSGTLSLSLNEAFERDVVEGKFSIMSEHVGNLIRHILRTDEFIPENDFRRLALDTLCHYLMGLGNSPPHKKGNNVSFQTRVLGVLETYEDLWSQTSFSAKLHWKKAKRMRTDLRHLRAIITEAVTSQLASSELKDESVVHKVMHALKDKSSTVEKCEAILDNAMLLLILGVQAIASASFFLFYMIIRDPAIRTEVEKEIQQTTGGAKLSLIHLPSLEYLTAVLRETLRLFPIVPTLAFRPTEPCLRSHPVSLEIEAAEQYVLRSDDRVLILLEKIHRDGIKGLWDSEPLEFVPRRMKGERFDNLPPDAWIPFGNGLIGCLGEFFAPQLILTTIGTLLQNFHFQFANNGMQSATLKVRKGLISRPEFLRGRPVRVRKSQIRRFQPEWPYGIGSRFKRLSPEPHGDRLPSPPSRASEAFAIDGHESLEGSSYFDLKRKLQSTKPLVLRFSAAVRKTPSAAIWLREFVDRFQKSVDPNLGARAELAVIASEVLTSSVPDHLPAETKLKKNTSLLGIYYGSNTGTCSLLADRLAAAACRKGVEAILLSLNAAISNFSRTSHIVVISATYDGQPTSDGKEFYHWLRSLSGDELDNVKYAVFGAGHSEWGPAYQKVPAEIEEIMKARGAIPLCRRGETDSANGRPFSDFDYWSNGILWPALPLEWQSLELHEAHRPELEVEVLPSWPRVGLRKGVVLTSRRLQGARNSGQLIEVELPRGLGYQVGDYLVVQSHNPREAVKLVRDRFNIEEDAMLRIRSSAIDQIVSARDYLTYAVDISRTASQNESTSTDHLYQKLSSYLSLTEFLESAPPSQISYFQILSSPYVDGRKCSIYCPRSHPSVLFADGILRLTVIQSAIDLPQSEDQTESVVMVCSLGGLPPFRAFVEGLAYRQKDAPKCETEATDDTGGVLQLLEGTAEVLLYVVCNREDLDTTFLEELEMWHNAQVVKLKFANQQRGAELSLNHQCGGGTTLSLALSSSQSISGTSMVTNSGSSTTDCLSRQSLPYCGSPDSPREIYPERLGKVVHSLLCEQQEDLWHLLSKSTPKIYISGSAKLHETVEDTFKEMWKHRTMHTQSPEGLGKRKDTADDAAEKWVGTLKIHRRYCSDSF